MRSVCLSVSALEITQVCYTILHSLSSSTSVRLYIIVGVVNVSRVFRSLFLLMCVPKAIQHALVEAIIKE